MTKAFGSIQSGKCLLLSFVYLRSVRRGGWWAEVGAEQPKADVVWGLEGEALQRWQARCCSAWEDLISLEVGWCGGGDGEALFS